MSKKRIVLALALPALSACTGITCTSEGRYAVQVEVRDALTGAPATEGARLIVTEGAYADTVVGGPGAPPVLAAAAERVGTYEVRVEKAGYQDWVRPGVAVRRTGGCDALDPARLTALLQPLAAAR